jgi:hypothetical protein
MINPMKLSKSFFFGAFISFFGLLLLSEILLRLSVPTGFWYRHFDVSGDMTSLAELEDRFQFAVPPAHRVLLFGDSVLGASALMEHRVPEARSHALSRKLRGNLQPDGYNTLSLGSDGLLLPDIDAINLEVAGHPPEKILLLLNFRMFSRDFAGGPKALSRSFLLKANLPPEIRERITTNPPPSLETFLGDQLYSGMCEHWYLFREAQMLKTLWYYPSQKDFFQGMLERVVGRDESQSDIVEAALKQKVAPYYQPYLWDSNDLPLTCLKQILDGWSLLPSQVVVILTPQNKKFLGSYLDEPSFEKNRETLARLMKSYKKSGVLYEDWADRYPATDFLDHCHLTPDGNEQYAKDLKSLLEKGPK